MVSAEGFCKDESESIDLLFLLGRSLQRHLHLRTTIAPSRAGSGYGYGRSISQMTRTRRPLGRSCVHSMSCMTAGAAGAAGAGAGAAATADGKPTANPRRTHDVLFTPSIDRPQHRQHRQSTLSSDLMTHSVLLSLTSSSPGFPPLRPTPRPH